MLSLLEFLKDRDRLSVSEKVEVYTLHFPVVCAVAGGIWTVVTFVVEHKDAPDKLGQPSITLLGQGVVAGRDAHIGGNVITGPTTEQIAQIQRPSTEQLRETDA